MNAEERPSRVKQLRATVARKIGRRAAHIGKCALCGMPCKANLHYCHVHSWAEGESS